MTQNDSPSTQPGSVGTPGGGGVATTLAAAAVGFLVGVGVGWVVFAPRKPPINIPLSGPTSFGDCETPTQPPPGGMCPQCANCTWSERTNTCVIDGYYSSTCYCFEGEKYDCGGNRTATCKVTDRTNAAWGVCMPNP
jgi:hypothetical protein